MSERARLKRLELEAFRGACERLSVPLDAPLNIIYGPNGSGKSTLATAIEWALFPVESSLLGQTGIAERRLWEVRHVHAGGQPEVILTLDHRGAEFEIRQSGARGATKTGLPFPCTYADFKHLVFIHQETIRDFLVGQPGPREAAFSRLLGAGWARDLTAGMERARRELRCKEADSRVASLEQLLRAKMEEVRRLLSEEKSRAREANLSEPWSQAAGQLHAEIVRQLLALCERAGVPPPPEPALDPLPGYAGRLNRIVDSLRHTGPAHRQSELAARQSRMEAARGGWTEAVAGWRERRAQLRAFEKEHGSLDDIQRKAQEASQAVEATRRALAALDRKRAVVREAAAYLRETEAPLECPVCERPVEGGLAEHLDRRLQSHVSAEEARLRKELDERTAALRACTAAAEEHPRLAAVLRAAEEHGRRVRQQVESALGRVLSRDEDPAAATAIEAEALQAELAKLQEAVRNWLADLQAVEQQGRKMEVLARIQSLEHRIRRLGAVRQSPEWAAMLSAQQALSISEQTLRLAAERTKALSIRMAESNLHRVAGPIRDYYIRLTQRADFPAVTINAEKKYEVGVGDGEAAWAPTAVLNLTDMNSLALAVVAGMAVEFRSTTGLDFLILDDPSQGMDPGVCLRLAGILSDLSEQIQILVTTADPNLLGAIERSPRRKNIIRLQPREPAEGRPSVQIAAVEADSWMS